MMIVHRNGRRGGESASCKELPEIGKGEGRGGDVGSCHEMQYNVANDGI